MLIFGHKFINNQVFYHITNIEDISHTPPSSTIYFAFNEDNLDIISYSDLNKIDIVLSVANITELIYASALNAKYIIVDKKMAKLAQSIAENYLFDAKILVKIYNDDEIEEIALLNIDGVIYPNAIIKINS